MADAKVMACIPSTGTWHADMGLSLARLAMYDPRIVAIRSTQGTLLPHSRETLVEDAAEAGVSHILWLDSDMVFPETVAERLLAHGLDIVGANYSTRRAPLRGTSHTETGRLQTTDASTGLQEVDGIGFGCLLMRVDVFKRVERPWFNVGWIKQDGKAPIVFGEDIYFCYKARKLGMKVWVDHDLSKEVGHIGERVFRHTDMEFHRA